MAGDAGNGNRLYVAVGDVVRVRLPWSEVCMHMQVAGQAMYVAIVDAGGQPAAQLITDDGSRFSFPILLGEAGIREDSGRLYVPTRAVVPPVAGLRLMWPELD